MSFTYYLLQQQYHKHTSDHASVTVTVGLFGAHLDVYCNKVKLSEIPYTEEDARRLQLYFRGLSELCAPYIPIERFLRALKPSA